MKFTDLAREIAYPLTQAAMAMALVFFGALIIIAVKAGLPGLFLLLVTLPAYARYLLTILEDRVHGRKPEPPTAEMFSLVDSLWTLFPLVPGAALVWLEYVLVQGDGFAGSAYRPLLAALPVLAFILLMPASLTILVMTRSPLASLNLLGIFAVVKRSLPGYLVIPLVTVVGSAFLYALSRGGLPSWLLAFGASYVMFLFCSLTGSVMHRSAIHREVDILLTGGPDQPTLDRRLLADRQAVATHAYGFISRGNRAGGLQHVQQRINEETDVDGAWQWFFDEMMRWESSDAALYFAQLYLSRLLRIEMDAVAIRVLTRCLYRNPRFRPLDQDRQLLSQLLQKHRREDLLRQLGN